MSEAAPNRPAAPPSGLDRLRREVLDQGLCVACGACLGLCPHLVLFDGQVAAPDVCGLASGRCYDLCPQALEPGPEVRRQALRQAGGAPWSEALGPVQAAHWARAAAPELRQRAQYGGVVSTLAALALEMGLVREMIVTQAGENGAPEGARVGDREGALASAGSIYAAGGALMQLNQALAEEAGHALGLVGLPCQAAAAFNLRRHPDHAGRQRLALVIGLFCTLNLSARGLKKVLDQAGIAEPPLRADFPPPPAGVLSVTTRRGIQDIPLDQVRPAVLAGCACCPDLTAEAADIAVGAAEGEPGWNTVLVRNAAGARLWAEAVARGLVQTKPVPEATWSHLGGAAEAKRNRGLKAGKERRA